MKISTIYALPAYSTHHKNNQVKNLSCEDIKKLQKDSLCSYCYKDYNISFGERLFRTPENFYEQDFNQENMPQSMKNYLNEDYENRKLIPPAQMMKIVFDDVDCAQSFEEVKEFYPDEKLFEDLKIPNKNYREGILAEINIIKDGNKPLFKDGKDDLGMYLLKKIYLEGKILKEINKDFKKDVSEYYDGLSDITYQTLGEFGIHYPNLPFWRSFIATREDFPYVPVKRKYHPSEKARKHSESPQNTENPSPPSKRKYNNKKCKNIQNDIKSSSVEREDDIEKVIVKRFCKDDPEATFLVKYMSPIMAVAAERAHLSEEMKSFCEYENDHGKTSKKKTMFARFWDSNPFFKEVFATAIVDTIEMFESIYAAGGNIPINVDLEEVKPDSKEQKIIDYVNEEFLDLLFYSQGIKPRRDKMYLEHDKIQQDYENTLGIKAAKPDAASVADSGNVSSAQSGLGRNLTDKNTKIYNIKTKDGKIVTLELNPEIYFDELLKNLSKYYPDKYAKDYMKYVASNSDKFDDRFKLTLATKGKGYDFDDEQLMSDEDFETTMQALAFEHYLYSERNDNKNTHAVRLAMAGTLACLTYPQVDLSIYYKTIPALNQLLRERLNDTNANNAKKMINDAYSKYCQPLTPSTQNKITLLMLDYLSKYESGSLYVRDNNLDSLFLMLKDIQKNKLKRQALKEFFYSSVTQNPELVCLLDKNIPAEYKQVRAQDALKYAVSEYLLAIKDAPKLFSVTMSKDVYDKYINSTSEPVTSILRKIISSFNRTEMFIFTNK